MSSHSTHTSANGSPTRGVARVRRAETQPDHMESAPAESSRVLRLQQVVGNRAVAWLAANRGLGARVPDDPGLRGHDMEVMGGAGVSAQRHFDGELQRVPTEPAPTASSAAAPGTDLGSVLALRALEDTRAEATARSFKLGAYATKGLRVVDGTKAKMIRFSDQYGNAYQTYADVVRQGRAEAQDQQEWINIFSGIAIGVGVGLLSEVIIGEAILSAASTVAVEVAGEAAEAVVAGGASQVIPRVSGQTLEPGGIHPALMNSQIWETLSRLYRTVGSVQQIGWHLPLLLGNTEYAIGQLRLIDAGAEAEMSRPELVEMAISLTRVNRQMRMLDAEIEERMVGLDSLLARLSSPSGYGQDELEQDIWIMWISGIANDDSDILDLDAIEDHLSSIGVLGDSGRLGVDFGSWTSEHDVLQAIAAARRAASGILARFEAIMIAEVR